MIDKFFFKQNDMKLIPIKDINISLDPYTSIGYDLTVEDYFTFATYDGVFIQDTMAIFHPLTEESQKNIKLKMCRAQSGNNSSSITFELSKEMAIGLYTITKPVISNKSHMAISKEDLEMATDPYIPVIFKNQKTTMGKALFNSCLPLDYPFIDKLITKSIANDIIKDIVNKYGSDIGREAIYKMEQIGFKFATIMGSSLTLDQLVMPNSIDDIKKKIAKSSPEEAVKYMDQAESILHDHLKGKGLYDMVESGAAKGWGQPRQMLIAKGVVADINGKLLDPIPQSFADGLTPKEYFNASAASRSGISNRVLNTASSGYLSRKLVYVMNNVEAGELVDCKTSRTLSLKLNDNIASRLTGRYIIKNKKLILYDGSKTGIIELRSPIYCESPKICHVCYGELIRRHKSRFIGVLAGQTIGEIGTQLLMRTFHTGGAVTLKKRDILKDIEENDKFATISILENCLRQDGMILNTLNDCKLTIDLNNYEMNDNIMIDDVNNKIWVKSLLAVMEYEGFSFNIILDYPVELFADIISIVKKESITIKYQKDDSILQVRSEATEVKENILYVERLLRGQEVYKDTEHLLMKLFNVYKDISNMDLVHMEILISNVLRDREKTYLPARLGQKWDPILMNFKNVIYNSGFIQGLGFEDINQGIISGLVNENENEPSILEKVLTGRLIDKK